MRYIDNGAGDSLEDALFPWLTAALTADVVGIRWQSGFFEANVLGVFAPTLQRLAREDLDTIVLVGSNNGETLCSNVHRLVDVLGLPRHRARLGVVRYANGLYHPKAIHLCYRGGREAAYVGSANLTAPGVDGRNVEAGILLNTDEGDPAAVVGDVKQAVDAWFDSQPNGLFEVRNHDDVDALGVQGVLTIQRVHRRPTPEGGGAGVQPLPRRPGRHNLPPPPDPGRGEDDGIEDVPIEEHRFEDHVMVAELAGPGRWGQAAFPQWFIENFFQVLPDTDDVLRLSPVTQADGLGEEEEVRCGYKAGSRNWYYELSLAAAMGAYPRQPPKPIGVFQRVRHQTFRYTILMPDDESYADVAAFLEDNHGRLNRPANQLPRAIESATALREAWPNNWFFAD